MSVFYINNEDKLFLLNLTSGSDVLCTFKSYEGDIRIRSINTTHRNNINLAVDFDGRVWKSIRREPNVFILQENVKDIDRIETYWEQYYLITFEEKVLRYCSKKEYLTSSETWREFFFRILCSLILIDIHGSTIIPSTELPTVPLSIPNTRVKKIVRDHYDFYLLDYDGKLWISQGRWNLEWRPVNIPHTDINSRIKILDVMHIRYVFHGDHGLFLVTDDPSDIFSRVRFSHVSDSFYPLILDSGRYRYLDDDGDLWKFGSKEAVGHRPDIRDILPSFNRPIARPIGLLKDGRISLIDIEGERVYSTQAVYLQNCRRTNRVKVSVKSSRK